MSHPVGMSFLGGFLIVFAAGWIVGLLALVLMKTTVLRTFCDIALGTLGGFVVMFVLPMNGITFGNVIGWLPALALGTIFPMVSGHVLFPPTDSPK
jgi:hypothetical protein